MNTSLQHWRGAARILPILLIAASLTVSAAGADSLFDLLATPTPSPAETPGTAPTLVPSASTGNLFDLLATASPSTAASASPAPSATPAAVPTAAPSPTAAPAQTALPREMDLFGGFGYSSMSGRAADREVINEEAGTKEFIYEQVSGEDFQAYGVFLQQAGCEAQQLSTDQDTALACLVSHRETQLAFLLVYQSDVQTLTLVWAPDEAQHSVAVCSECNRGLCKECHGSGFFKCGDCGGLGRCPDCHGRRGISSPGYGGVGTGSFEPCSGCNGTGRCTECEGKGRVECTECDHGVCRTCHGHYVLDP